MQFEKGSCIIHKDTKKRNSQITCKKSFEYFYMMCVNLGTKSDEIPEKSDRKLNPTNNQKYYHYNSIEDAENDYPEIHQCSKCKS